MTAQRQPDGAAASRRNSPHMGDLRDCLPHAGRAWGNPPHAGRAWGNSPHTRGRVAKIGANGPLTEKPATYKGPREPVTFRS
jgi:hypothetical protein